MWLLAFPHTGFKSRCLTIFKKMRNIYLLNTEKYPGYIIWIQHIDFIITYDESASKTSKILGTALVKRDDYTITGFDSSKLSYALLGIQAKNENVVIVTT
jgi:hypothetical protein